MLLLPWWEEGKRKREQDQEREETLKGRMQWVVLQREGQ